DDNLDNDRKLSAKLYGGDIHMRIAQEKILGIGGVRALRRMGIAPTVWHMNEGHSAFLTLERLRELVSQEGLSWNEASEALAPSVCFTTHTPVPAGHDVFDQTMMEGHFWGLRNSLGMSADEFMRLGQAGSPPAGPFSLTVLALRMSRFRNGVSQLHGEVSRQLWTNVWPGLPEAEVPIFHITNGIHVPTWVAPALRELYDRHLDSDWREEPQNPKNWKNVDKLPAGELWKTHVALKKSMVDAVRQRVKRRMARLGESPGRQGHAETLLDPDALTLGFARRFATYKRAVLLFTDPDRLVRMLHDPDRPVQLVFAGKAHPADVPGQQFIQQIYEYSRSAEFAGKVVIVEDYDMELARYLVAGVDVWLNNPRRPLEASGTSGQKAAMNGVLNFSVLDGWWAEGYNGKNGFKIGEPVEYVSYDEQDVADVNSLYATLEDEIVPLYYDRDRNGLPTTWVDRMKESIKSLSPLYSTHRMLVDYCEQMYVPAERRWKAASAKKFAQARSIAEWRGRVGNQWGQVAIQAQIPAEDEVARGQRVAFRAWATLGRLKPEDVRVEVYAGVLEDGSLRSPQTVELSCTGRQNGLYLFEGELSPWETGSIGYGVRVRPVHPDLAAPDESGRFTWASSVN
ncbi:MAG: alpha-glucan family phosphorylase, partial [Candidatus Eremiobacterota bacterium]